MNMKQNLGVLSVALCSALTAIYVQGESEIEKLERCANSIELLGRAMVHFEKVNVTDEIKVENYSHMDRLIDLIHARCDRKDYEEWYQIVQDVQAKREAKKALKTNNKNS